MRDRRRTTKDVNLIAAAVLEAATDETGKYQKDPDAVDAGREGGRSGGRVRAAKLTPEERSASARRAAQARWAARKTGAAVSFKVTQGSTDSRISGRPVILIGEPPKRP